MDGTDGGLSELLVSAAQLSIALGGARVRLSAPLDPQAAAALAEQIREGLAGGPVSWRVTEIEVGDGPHVVGITVTPW